MYLAITGIAAAAAVCSWVLIANRRSLAVEHEEVLVAERRSVLVVENPCVVYLET